MPVATRIDFLLIGSLVAVLPGRARLLLPVVIIAAPGLAAAAIYSILVFSRELD